jgi:hypothetical protein
MLFLLGQQRLASLKSESGHLLLEHFFCGFPAERRIARFVQGASFDPVIRGKCHRGTMNVLKRAATRLRFAVEKPYHSASSEKWKPGCPNYPRA